MGMDEPSRRKQLADRLINYPLISMFILSPAFPLTVAALIILAVLIGLCIPKLWVTTPPGFSPVIKVSVLDLWQAAVLRNRARHYQAAGSFEEAHYAWQSAIANNRGDANQIAESLANLLKIQYPPREFLETGISQAFWLMRLTGTNELALNIVPAVFVKCRMPEYAIDVLGKFEPPLPPAQETAMLKALFLTGRIDQYHRRREQFGKSLQPDPELELCDAGYWIVSGPPDKSDSARKIIADATQRKDLAEFACRVQLAVAARLEDLQMYEQGLERLRENGSETLFDHLIYWKLLETAGRSAEARHLAETFPQAPSNPTELFQYASTLVSLGHTEQAQKLFARYAPVFANSDKPDVGTIWIAYADLLIQTRKWDDLQALAVQLRMLHPARTVLNGYTYFLEGRAVLARGRVDEAMASFKMCADQPFLVPAAGMHAARHLLLLGYADLAERIAEPLEQSLANEAEYWQLRFDIAYALKNDETTLLRAAIKARELDPANLMRQSNYAAALLINRQNPAEAISITFKLFQNQPNSLVARVNHSFAMALNKRYSEAAEILNAIDHSKLTEAESTAYHFCLLEIHFGLGQFDLARQDLSQINPRFLFPSEAKRVEEIRAQIESDMDTNESQLR